MDKDDIILIKTIEAKRRQCEERGLVSHSAFLDIRQCAAAEAEFRFSRHILYGGYEDAERRLMIFLPEHIKELSYENDPLAVLRVRLPKNCERLSHSDYLGSILALGIERSVTGDIIVTEDGADIIVLKSMADFLLSNYNQAGRFRLETELFPINELRRAEADRLIKRGSVASLRLDNVLGEAFDLSRSASQEAVRGGIVFLNGLQCVKPDKELSDGDRIVLRGRGKVILKETGQKSKKGRSILSLELYKRGR